MTIVPFASMTAKDKNKQTHQRTTTKRTHTHTHIHTRIYESLNAPTTESVLALSTAAKCGESTVDVLDNDVLTTDDNEDERVDSFESDESNRDSTESPKSSLPARAPARTRNQDARVDNTNTQQLF